LAVVIVLTGSLSASSQRASGFGAFAPVVVLGAMTWYLIFLLLNRELVTSAIASLLRGNVRRNYSRISILVSVAAYSLVVGVLLAVLYSGFLTGVLKQVGLDIHLNNPPPTVIPPTQNQNFLVASEHLSTYAALVALAIFAVSFFLIVRGFVRAAKERSIAFESPPEAADEAGAVVEQALQDLRQERDYHEVIFECYMRMCQILSNAGIAIRATNTPREYAETVGRKLKLGSDAVRGLTFLFEEARYSNHPVTDGQRALAIRNLESVRAVLAGNPVIAS